MPRKDIAPKTKMWRRCEACNEMFRSAVGMFDLGNVCKRCRKAMKDRQKIEQPKGGYWRSGYE